MFSYARRKAEMLGQDVTVNKYTTKDICLGSPFVRENGRTEEKKLT